MEGIRVRPTLVGGEQIASPAGWQAYIGIDKIGWLGRGTGARKAVRRNGPSCFQELL
jgi:hypothetical protein